VSGLVEPYWALFALVVVLLAVDVWWRRREDSRRARAVAELERARIDAWMADHERQGVRPQYGPRGEERP
jgi:hypothetical protein